MISVIIPVYKVEKYLRECVDSILTQTCTDMEVILVDDGSPDSCPQICDEYAAMDSRVKVIHKQNGGLSDARNAGLRLAAGEYICFIDSDDYLDDKNALDGILSVFEKENPDLVIFWSKALADGRIIGNDKTDYSACTGETSAEKIYNAVKADKLNFSACMMVAKRNFLITNNLFFKENIKSEDIEFGFRLYARCPQIAFYDRNPYVYRQREGSITATFDYPHLLTHMQIVTDGIRIAESCEGKLRLALLGYAAYQTSIQLGLMGKIKLTDEQERELDQYLQPACRQYLCRYALGRKAKLVAAVYAVMRYRLTKKILGFYLRNR